MTELNSYEFKTTIRGKEYEFICENFEDPLRYLLHIDEHKVLIRDINCDEPTEKITFAIRYQYLYPEKPIEELKWHYDVAYAGREIRSKEFMDELLDHIIDKWGEHHER